MGDERGPTLEAVVSRMKRLVQHDDVGLGSAGSNQRSCRIIALSATLPNIDDVALWLGATDHVFDFGISLFVIQSMKPTVAL